MKRYYPQLVPWTGGLYAVADATDRCLIGDPKPYHEANDEATARNVGAYVEGMSLEAMSEALQAAFPNPAAGQN